MNYFTREHAERDGSAKLSSVEWSDKRKNGLGYGTGRHECSEGLSL